jgi:hypothetical protein
LRYTFDAIDLNGVVIDSAEWDCATLEEAITRARGALVSGLLPGIDHRPFAVCVRDGAGQEGGRVNAIQDLV